MIDESSMDREKRGRAGSPCDGEGTNSQRFVCFDRHRRDTPYLLEGRVSMLDAAWVPLNGESKTNLPLSLRPSLRERFPGSWAWIKANGAHFQIPSQECALNHHTILLIQDYNYKSLYTSDYLIYVKDLQ